MDIIVKKLAKKIEENAGKRLHAEYQAKQYIEIMKEYISKHGGDNQSKE